MSQAVIASTFTIYGRVACPQERPIVGVWIQSSNGGSRWADWTPGSVAPWQATYQKDIRVNGSSTGIRLHVGCGGSRDRWYSTNLGAGGAGSDAAR